jgi:hypothetical protein
MTNSRTAPRSGQARPEKASQEGAPDDDDDDPVPQDPDEFRLEMVRRIHNFLRVWRDCSTPVCKRSHKCHGPPFRCEKDSPKHTRKQEARAMAKLQKLLKRELERRAPELL